jgi:hypothetical protein
MLHLDIPTIAEFKALSEIRSDACVSIYLPTTPLTQDVGRDRIAFANLSRQAREQLEGAGFDKRRLASLIEEFDDLSEEDEFWRLQAHSLAVLATPDSILTFRLPNALTATVQVSDRYHLKPLLRAITFPNSAFVLALSENAARLVEVFADLPPATVKIEGLPKGAADSVGKSSLNDRSPVGRIQGSEGQNVRLRQYARKVDAVLRPVLAGRETPLVLAATGRLADLYRSVNSYPNLLAGGISESPDRMSDAALADVARPVMDAAYRKSLDELRALYQRRAAQGRATVDLSIAARAATQGAIEVLLVDIDTVVPGIVDEETGAIHLADSQGASTYGVVDEIARRALNTGARVLGVRKPNLPAGEALAAILRYPV